jgi:Cu-Zn family superoxide dismutase
MRYVGAAALLVWLSVWPGVAAAQPQTLPVGANALVRDAGGRVIAEVTFREAPDQVLIALSFPDRALTGTHGIQIHANGRCDPPDFASAGGIFNPFGKQHGLLNPDGPMAGDLPSLVIGTSGLTSYNTTAPLVKLGSGGPATLLKPGGTSLVIYAQTDDDRTQPEGSAGARIACGVIVQGPLQAGASAQINLATQPAATSNDSRLGALFVALGGIVLIGVGVALRQHRLRL